MSEKRKLIRKALLSILRGRTDAGENVFANPTQIHWEENLPVINIYTRGEEIRDTESAPRYLNRSLFCETEVIAEADTDEDLSDLLDDICEQIEQALSIDDSLKGTADDCFPVRTSDIDVATEGAKPIGKTSITFEIQYHEYAPRDQGARGLRDLEGIDTDWRIGHDDEPPTMVEPDAAKDTIDFP